LRDHYLASEYLEALHKDLLESNLNSIFSTLRNTERFKLYDTNGHVMWFLTMSPSEWRWDELGEYILEVNGWSNDSSLSISVFIVRNPVSSRYIS